MSYRLPGREGARSSVVRGWVVRAVGGGCRAGAGLGCCEELVHDLGAGGDHRPQLAPVHDLGGAGGGVPGQPGDLLDADPAVAQQADERGPQLARRPAVPAPAAWQTRLNIFRTFPTSSAAARWVVNTSPVSCQPSPAARRSAAWLPVQARAPGPPPRAGRGCGGTVRSWSRRAPGPTATPPRAAAPAGGRPGRRPGRRAP